MRWSLCGGSCWFWFLTVLCDEGQAAVHDNGDVVPAQLLLPQSVPFASGRPLDVRVPQREVHAAHALQVQSPGGERNCEHLGLRI